VRTIVMAGVILLIEMTMPGCGHSRDTGALANRRLELKVAGSRQ
jgi:hypothetical protein